MSAALPFDGFLDVLRAKGYGVGLHEYFALANLLKRWDQTHTEEFGDALSALVGRSEEEVQGIRRLFVETYLPPPTPLPRAATRQRRVFPRRWTWSIAAFAAGVVVAATMWTIYRRSPPSPPPPIESTTNAGPVTGPQPVVSPIELPPPPAPSLPDPPKLVERRLVAEMIGAAFLVALAIFWALKTRDTTRMWLRDTWASALAALPGPYHFGVVLRDRPSRLPRTDVEDAATILGRTFTPEAQARELDVRRSVRLTLRRGLMPQLVFKPRRTAQTILVFQDVCREMQIWRPKVDAFLTDLLRQGVALERWYFDGDPRRVADSPYRTALRFETVMRRRPSSPVLVVSTGSGIEATLATGDEAWLMALRSAPRKSWLTPVADLQLWPDVFRALGLDVWPMTRIGLTRVARDLAGIEGEAADRVRSRLVSAGRVTQDDLERMKRLASVVPHPSTELLEMLRRQFAPDVSDAVVLHLLTEAAGDLSSPVVRLSDDELRRCLHAMRRESPQLEAAVRRAVLGVLLDSQPTPESTAHKRWQLAVALQQLQLADLEGSDASPALETIRTLGQSPIWEEVRSAVRRVPTNPDLARRLDKTLGTARGGRAQPPDAKGVALTPQPWSWPGIREVVPSALAASLVLATGLFFGVFPANTLEHVQDAYRLDYVVRAQPAQSGLQLQRRGNNSTPANSVTIFQGADVFRSNVAVPAQGTTSIPLTSSDTGKYYQARATLPGGNLAVSNAVWAPSDTAVIVSIDALPWANVSVQSDQATVGPQPTPFSASLVPGRYRLRFDNNGVTPPMDQVIDVTPANRVFRFTMPGFDPQRTATELARPR